MSDVLVLRTNRGGAALQPLLERYRGLAGLDLAVAADEQEGAVDVPAGVAKVSLTAAVVEGMGLPAVPRWGWRCGDYALYAVRRALPSHDRYWMIEPDVRLNTDDVAGFFRRFAAAPQDLLATGLGPRSPRWSHHAAMARFVPEVMGCLFPLVRLSGRALDHLCRRRAALHAEWEAANAAGPELPWPNDESFVASELQAAGFDIADLAEVCPGIYSPEEGWGWRYPVHPEAPAFRQPDDKIYHPVMTDDAAFAGRMLRAIAWSRRKNAGGALSAIPWSLRSMPLDRDRPAGPDLRPRGDTALQLLLAASQVPALREMAQAQGRALFPPPPQGRRPILHQTVRTPAAEGFATARPGDFDLGPVLAAECFPRARATPYAADFARRELHFACVPAGAPLLEAPFFYNAQRAAAQSVARVPFGRLTELYPGAAGDAAAPMIVMSIGRCGSTLLNRLLGADGSVAVSEPDVFSQVAGLNGTLGAQKNRKPAALRGEAAVVLRASLQALATWAGVPADRLAVKLRSHSNGAVGPILAAFPRARYVFVFREIDPWVRSFVTAFGHSPGQIAHALRQGILACAALVQAGVTPRILWYEAMSADPSGTVEALRGGDRPLSEDEKAAIAAIGQADSQAGTRLSRAARSGRAAEPAVAASLAEFHALWAERRPAEAIAQLGLPY